jgi:hypothetical protein
MSVYDFTSYARFHRVSYQLIVESMRRNSVGMHTAVVRSCSVGVEL